VVGGAGGASLGEVENETQAIRVALKPSTTEKWAALSLRLTTYLGSVHPHVLHALQLLLVQLLHSISF
jgi:hypothetical protein